MKFENLRFAPLILLLFISIFADSSSQFWSNEIESSLNRRSNFFKSIGISDDGLQINSWSNTRKELVASSCELFDNHQDPWYNFVVGMIAYSKGDPGADSLFSQSLHFAMSDPGSLWLLFIEFNRYGISQWSEKCLLHLEKQLSDAGAMSSRVISTQLKSCAYSFEKHGNHAAALKLYLWAEKFDPTMTWTIQRRFWMAFPTDIDAMENAAKSFYTVLSRSWSAQIEFAESIYSWIRSVLFIFMISIFLIFMIKYLPSALHPLADLYPTAMSVTIRTLLSSLIFISLLSLSLFFFLWISAFLIWRFLSKGERIFASIALIILVLTPIDSQLVDLFQRVKDPDGTLSLYRNITTEGYSDGTYEKLLQNDHIVPDDSHNLLGLAICAYKNGNLQSSQLLIEKALKLTPFDPVILVTAGNIYFQKDLIEKSMQVLTTASTQTHRDVSSVFNLSQCYLKQMETVKGTEVMDKAAKEDQFTVNAFVQKNDTYYSKNWPALRCTMIPDYTPFYFWKHLFFETNQNWKSTTQSWGTSFLGINPIHSFLLFIIFFLTILITPFFYPTRRIKKLFECKSCGRTICRKCSEGILCATCNNHTSFVKSDKKQDEIHAGIIYKFELFRTIKQCSLDMLFPGIGSFLFSKRSLRNSTILVFISSCIFATYTTLYHLYNQSGMTIEISLVLTALLLYNAFFIYNRIKDLLAFLKSHSRTN